MRLGPTCHNIEPACPTLLPPGLACLVLPPIDALSCLTFSCVLTCFSYHHQLAACSGSSRLHCFSKAPKFLPDWSQYNRGTVLPPSKHISDHLVCRFWFKYVRLCSHRNRWSVRLTDCRYLSVFLSHSSVQKRDQLDQVNFLLLQQLKDSSQGHSLWFLGEPPPDKGIFSNIVWMGPPLWGELFPLPKNYENQLQALFWGSNV